MKQIEAETLREWLDAQRPVTLLDVRTDDDRAQWAIPGSVHVNAYEALREGRPGAQTRRSRAIARWSPFAMPVASARPPRRSLPDAALMHDHSPAV